jgi:tetratricopeptide (TPR) repeat protein
MNAIEYKTSDFSSSDGLKALMNGMYKSAIRNYQIAVRDPTYQIETKLELACAFSGNQQYKAARAILQEFQSSELPPAAKSRYLTAEALNMTEKGLTEEIPSILAEAISLDASFPLPYFSLGKYYQVVERDSSKALDFLQQASTLADRSYGPLFHLVSLQLGEGNFGSARTLSSQLIKDFPTTPKTVLAFLITQLVSTPFRGRLFLLLASLSLFIPYWGPIFLSMWSLGTLASLLYLRKLASYLVAFSLVSEVWFLFTYIIRFLILGIFP